MYVSQFILWNIHVSTSISTYKKWNCFCRFAIYFKICKKIQNGSKKLIEMYKFCLFKIRKNLKVSEESLTPILYKKITILDFNLIISAKLVLLLFLKVLETFKNLTEIFKFHIKFWIIFLKNSNLILLHFLEKCCWIKLHSLPVYYL